VGRVGRRGECVEVQEELRPVGDPGEGVVQRRVTQQLLGVAALEGQ
jgi:hypothetical protein